MLREKLTRRAHKADLSLDSKLVEKLEAYFELLRQWNQKISLTSLPVQTAGDEAIDRLLIEPVLAAKYVPGASPVVVDVGSGGGSPAIPLRLAVAGMSLRMIESKTRKAAFLREVVRRLELGAEVETARFEQLLTRSELHEAADLVTLRALRVDRKLVGLQAFLKPGGLLFLFRSGETGTEANLVGPPLVWMASHTLLAPLRSRLVIFQKIR